jgi:large subunit ribosomal protein L10
MQVPQFNELRSRLSGVKAELRVVKNTLLRRALQDSNLPDLESYLHGQSAVVIGEADVSAAAKVLKNFTAEFKKPVLKVGILDRAVLSESEIVALADLPSKEVLQAKLLGLLLAPASTLVRLINTPASQIAQVLQAYSDKGEAVSGTAAATEAAPADEAKAPETAPASEGTPAAT